VVLAALEKTRAALAEEYGSDNVATWRMPLDQHVFETKNYLGIPQAGADEGLAVGTAMNRGTENDMIRFHDGTVTFCAVTRRDRAASSLPTGQSRPTTRTSSSSTPTSAAGRRPSTVRTWKSRP
jgi:penicillin G amidase